MMMMIPVRLSGLARSPQVSSSLRYREFRCSPCGRSPRFSGEWRPLLPGTAVAPDWSRFQMFLMFRLMKETRQQVSVIDYIKSRGDDD